MNVSQICGPRKTQPCLVKKLKEARWETKTGVFMEQNRNGQLAKRFRPLGSEAGQLGSLNRDPEEQTQKPLQKTRRSFFAEALDLFPKGLCACRSERSLHNQIRLRSQSEPVLH